MIAGTSLGCDDQGRVLQVASALSGTNLAAYGYAYDVDNSTGLSTMLGQRTSLSASVPSQGFSNALTKYYYDPLYQLMRADYPNVSPFSGEIDSWTYDDIGNRLTATVNGVPATYTYLKNGANPLNGQRLSNDGVNAYTWDNNGSNLTRNGTPGNFTFGYSVDNRLSSISGAATASYTYDYQGRRTSKTVGGVTTTYLYDGLNLVTETTGGNPVNYAFGPGIDEPLATYQNGTLGYMAPDALGSVAILSSASGTVQNSFVFDAWGSTRASSATLTDSFGYTAREFGEAGLLAYRARYLQTGVGRFSQEDPVEFRGENSFYAYAMNTPLVLIDPLGLDASQAHVECDDNGGFVVVEDQPSRNSVIRTCLQRHEEDHIDYYKHHCPNYCAGPPKKPKGTRIMVLASQDAESECSGWRAEYECLKAHLKGEPDQIPLRRRMTQLLLGAEKYHCDTSTW